MHYPVLVNPRKPSIEQDAHEETKKGARCEGQKGPENQRQPVQTCR
ncbi:hypothetical protein [Bradyrhizobium sp.]|nr:hypothetical protein [Bradyrhizobium sp.]HEV2157902.1 hypothetical protein [Bradyrhizobium sp.]